MDQVVLVGQKELSDLEEVARFSTAQEVLCADHSDPPLPDQGGSSEVVQRRAISSLQVPADNRTATHVDQVPVVDVGGVVEVVAVYGRPDAMHPAALHRPER